MPMGAQEPLFRLEAVEAKQQPWLGSVLISQPMSSKVITCGVLSVALMLMVFSIMATYTKKISVFGELVYEAGQARVFAKGDGVITRVAVKEGEFVRKGQILFEVSSEAYSSQGSVQQANIKNISEQINFVKKSQLDDEALLHQKQDVSAARYRSSVQQIGNFDSQIVSQKKLLDIAQDAFVRYRGLMDKGYISLDQVQERESRLYGQRQVLSSLINQRAKAVQEAAEERMAMTAIDTELNSSLLESQRKVSELERQKLDSQRESLSYITAPIDGEVSTPLVMNGTRIDATKTLIGITPPRAPLVAEIYVPSKAIGFLEVGDRVDLNLKSFPFQKYGRLHATIVSISSEAVSAYEIKDNMTDEKKAAELGEKVYIARAVLDHQSLLINGRERALLMNMSFDARVKQETRKIYQWVLDPNDDQQSAL